MATTVGIRQFRAGLAEYLDSDEPVAITRHGRTVGYFIPTRSGRAAEIASLRAAAASLDELLARNGVDPDEVVAEYAATRRAANK
ncbi:MAG: type II toxin-antitoxin system Phd/YefM family antitoxin [Actinobacteria bacterium]|nr:type II toxin-antitoxin system Phd/YefM family antitoxin [Actinomycetota bacterium]